MLKQELFGISKGYRHTVGSSCTKIVLYQTVFGIQLKMKLFYSND